MRTVRHNWGFNENPKEVEEWCDNYFKTDHPGPCPLVEENTDGIEEKKTRRIFNDCDYTEDSTNDKFIIITVNEGAGGQKFNVIPKINNY